MARAVTAQKQRTANSCINEDTLATYAEMFKQTTDSLSTYLINMDHLLNTSEDGASWLLRLICERYEFIINDMQRVLERKEPLDGIRLEFLDFSEKFKRENSHYFQRGGDAQ